MQTCLVIDESSVVRKVASRILFQLGLTVESAGSLDEARALLSGHLSDLVIVSATLPDTPVEDAIRALRTEPGGASAVLLASMVEANLGRMTRAKRAGANGFIYRPFDRQALTDWLNPFIRAAA